MDDTQSKTRFGSGDSTEEIDIGSEIDQDTDTEVSASGLDEYLNASDEDLDVSVTESRLGGVRGYRRFLFYSGLIWLVLLVLEWLYPLFIYKSINSFSAIVPNMLGGQIETFTLTVAGEVPHVFMTAFLATFCFLSIYSASQPRSKGLVLGMALGEFLLGGLFLLAFYTGRQPYFVFSLSGYFFTGLAVVTLGVFLFFLNRIPD